MIYNQRQVKLLKLLLKEEDYIAVKSFSKELSVSTRTIYSDLDKIEAQLNTQNIQIKRKPGVGIKLVNVGNANIANINIDSSSKGGSEARRITIMETLLFKDSSITFEALSQKYFVSKTSIKNDLQFAFKILSRGNNIQIKSDCYGTRIIGSEVDIQAAYTEFNQYILAEKYPLFLKNNDENLALLKKYYGDNIVSVCYRILFDFIKNNGSIIAEYYTMNVLNTLIVLVYRLSKGHHIDSKKILQEDEIEFDIYKQNAEDILKQISSRLKITYNKNDIDFFQKNLLANKFESISTIKYKDIVQDLIKKVGDTLDVNLINDKDLYNQLLNHIPSMIYRLKLGIKATNPFVDQIKTEFRLTFNIVWIIISEYEKKIGIIFNEDEIGFLTLYFQTSLEKNHANKKILIVCPMGIATSELLVSQLRNILPPFDLLQTASIDEISTTNLESFDCIITTVKLEIEHKNVINVSPILSAEDIKKITENNQDTDNVVNDRELKYLDYYTDDKMLFWNTNFSSKSEVFKYVENQLLDNGYIDNEYMNTLIEREKLGGTDLPIGIAIPHGNPCNVNETVISICHNNNCFKWQTHLVRVIIFVCVAEKDIKDIKNLLSDIYSLVENEENFKEFCDLKSVEEFRNYIN